MNKKINSRYLMVEILDKVFYEGAYSNIELSKRLGKENIDIKDRALVTEVVYGTIRYRDKIDFILKKFVKDLKRVDPSVLNILRSAVYQIMFLDKVPDYAVVNEAVEMTKKKSFASVKFVNGVLRNLLRNNTTDFFEGLNKKKSLAINYSFPNWMTDLFINQYGTERAEKIMKGLNTTPNVTVRVNELKGDYESTFDMLVEEGYDCEEGAVCPEAIIIKKGSSIENNRLFNEGYILVQDESAMLTAPCMDLEEGMTVIDLCAAPGGKTTHISEIMNNTGRVISCDIYEHKLKLIDDNCSRLGITNVDLKLQDACMLNSDFVSLADRVITDVPCSGLGIIRKKPEIKWTKSKKDLNELISIQREIMTNAWTYLKPGGIMLYSTCSINKEENEENVDWFLDRNNDSVIEEINIGRSENILYNSNKSVTILPSKDMDGFFFAKIRKKK